jgi:hypothetical protein
VFFPSLGYERVRRRNVESSLNAYWLKALLCLRECERKGREKEREREREKGGGRGRLVCTLKAFWLAYGNQ